MNRKPSAAPKSGYVWVQVAKGPQKGQWIQVLKPEYQAYDPRTTSR